MMLHYRSATYSCSGRRVSPVVANKPIVSRGNCASPYHLGTSSKLYYYHWLLLYLLFNVLQPGPEPTRSPLTWIRSPPDSEQLAATYPTPVETTPAHTDSSDTNNPKVGLDDPTSKVLPAALKRNKIKEEEWGDYAMLITYGPIGNGILLKSHLSLMHMPQEIESNDAWSLKKSLYICSKSWETRTRTRHLFWRISRIFVHPLNRKIRPCAIIFLG